MRSMLREGFALQPTARTLWEIQEKSLRVPVETATNLYRDVRQQAEQALREGEKRRLAVRDGASLRAYQAEVRAIFLNCIGGLPEANRADQASIVGRRPCGGFTLEKVLLSPREGAWATADVYVPKGRTEPGPAVLITVGHTDRGKADPEYQYVAQMMACAGFVALVLDPLGEGERFEHYESEMDFQPIQGCSGEHDLLDWKAKLMGLSLARYFLQDGVAALDYLASRADVDPARVALTGHSGGGTQTCMLMLAAGDRFACAAPCAYVSDTRAMMDCGVDPDNEMIWPGSVAQGLDYVDMLAGMAPKPILLLTNQHDFFPREGTLRAHEAAKALWRAAGSDTPPGLVTAESQHAYPQTLARAAAMFFSRHLTGQEADLSGFEFAPLPDRELWCTPEGTLLKAYPAMRTIHDELLSELAECERERRREPDEAALAWLSEALHMERVALTPEPRVYGEGVCGHYAYRLLAWRPQEGHWSAGALLRDMRRGDAALPTVIALWPEGLARLAEHAHWIHSALRQGWQVLVLDVAASGALAPAEIGHAGMHIGWGTMFILNAYLLQLGDSLFGLRARGVLAALRMLRDWPEADAARICFYGEGEMSRLAAVASLLTHTPACLKGDCQPFGEIVRERYHDQTHTHAWAFPGVLRHLDTGDMERQLRQQGLQAPDPSRFPTEGRARE